MSTLSSLLLRLEAVHHQRFLLDSQIDQLKREILARHKPATKRRKRTVGAEAVALVRATVKTLQEAGEPLPRQEIAARLGIKPVAADYRLRKAIAAGFVEKVGRRYRAAAEIPVL
jgi:hypothetical protein